MIRPSQVGLWVWVACGGGHAWQGRYVGHWGRDARQCVVRQRHHRLPVVVGRDRLFLAETDARNWVEPTPPDQIP